jgi:hypothetical protein
MTKEVYDKKWMEIKISFDAAKKELHREFAYANNPYKIGDIVADRIGTVKIEKIQIYLGLNPYPQCVYTGVELTKKGEPKKGGKKRSVYQSGIKTN